MFPVRSDEWSRLLEDITEDCIIQSIGLHPSLSPGMKLFRAGNVNVSARAQAQRLHFKQRKVWITVSDPHATWRKNSEETRIVLSTWKDLLTSTSLCISMLPRPQLQCLAAADAMADATMAGLGGYVKFPSGVSGWFQLKITSSDFPAVATWGQDSLQKHISAFELLAQCLLLQTCFALLKFRRTHCLLLTACDNSASEAAANKGLTSAIGMAAILPQLFRFQQLTDIHQRLQHIQGYRNDLADALSRFKPHALHAEDQVQLQWQHFVTPVTLFQSPDAFDVSLAFGEKD